MDPKHIITALAVMYIEEHGDRLNISKSALVDAYRKAGKLTVQVIQNHVTNTSSVVIYLDTD